MKRSNPGCYKTAAQWELNCCHLVCIGQNLPTGNPCGIHCYWSSWILKNHKQSTFRTQNLNLTQDHFPLQAARCLATDQKSRNPQEQSPGQRQEIRRCCWSPGRSLGVVGQQMCERKESCSERCWGLIQIRRMSWRAGRCWVEEPAAAAAEVEAEAWSGTVRWLEDQTCCYRSQMQTLLLLMERDYCEQSKVRKGHMSGTNQVRIERSGCPGQTL